METRLNVTMETRVILLGFGGAVGTGVRMGVELRLNWNEVE